MKEKYTGLEVAVIGLSGKFPKANNLDDFWQDLVKGEHSVSMFTDEELIEEGTSKALLSKPAYVKSGVYLKEKHFFDSDFFDFRTSEAELLDPQSRVFHQCCWEALEDAGYNPFTYKDKIGMYASASSNLNWEVYSKIKNKEILLDAYSVDLLSKASYIPSRVSYKLNLKGPSLFIQTACSSSLVAIHKACSSLLIGECSMAIAGGVSIKNFSKKGYLYQEGMIYSKDGFCKPFEAGSSGTIGGEGAGAVVLKRLKDAIKDGDNIYAIVQGSAINNDGSEKVGYTAPSVKGQKSVILKAQKIARVIANDIDYIETHGTATTLGDPIEIDALNQAFSFNGDNIQNLSCAIGSIKSNIGHLDAAAGIAAFIKTILVVKNRTIPANPYFKTPNPNINFNDGPFYVNKNIETYTDNKPMIAGISSFGIGGTNAHIIVKEYTNPSKLINENSDFEPIFISAKTESSLKELSKRHVDFFQNTPESLSNIAYTLSTGRAHFKYRRALVSNNKKELFQSLLDSEIFTVNNNIKSKVVFMFTGQGAQYKEMYKDLYYQIPEFKNQVDECFKIASVFSNVDYKSLAFDTQTLNSGELNLTEYTQPVLFIFEYALSKTLMVWGIIPDYMIGHSIGEYVAATISGVFSLKDAIKLVIQRGHCMASAPKGKMLSTNLDRQSAIKILNKTAIDIAAINTPSSVVLAGEEEKILTLDRQLQEDGYISKLVNTSHAFHSWMMEDIVYDFEDVLKEVTINTPKIPYISNVSGEFVTFDQINQITYWSDHLRHSVHFSEGVQKLLKMENIHFVEIGPGRTLCNYVEKNEMFNSEMHHTINMIRHRKQLENDKKYILNKLTRLWSQGLDVNWSKYYENESLKKVSLPTYAFDKKVFTVHADVYNIIDFDHLQLKETSKVSQEFIEEEILDDSNKDNPVDDTSISQKIVKIYSDLFGKKVTLRDNFFELGGDSLMALQVQNVINQRLGLTIKLKGIFDYPIIGELVRNLKGLNKDVQSIVRIEDREYYKVSKSQERIYFQSVLSPQDSKFNISAAFLIPKDLSEDVIREALNKLVDRHEILRTSFHEVSGQIVQKINPIQKANFEVISKTDSTSSLEEAFKGFIKPFDLSKKSMLRCGLFENFSEEERAFFIDIHHIICDGLSLNILVEEFYKIVYDMPIDNKLPIRYVDYASWQGELYTQNNNLEEFWKKQLNGNIPRVDLPIVKERSSVFTHKVKNLILDVNEDLYAGIKASTNKTETSEFIFFLSAFYILLSKISGHQDIIIGSDTNGRSTPELNKIIGSFVNILPLRAYVNSEQSFLSFLEDVKEMVLNSYMHQEFQFDQMVNLANEPRDMKRNPIFDIHFSMSNTFSKEKELEALQFKALNINSFDTSEYEFKIEIRESNKAYQIDFIYSSELYDDIIIKAFSQYYAKILKAVINDNNISIDSISL